MAFWHRFTQGWKQPAKKTEDEKKDSNAARQAAPVSVAPSSEQNSGGPLARSTGEAYRVLLGPHITEQATALGAFGQYAFKVNPKATKGDIAQAVRRVYHVHPVAVNVIRIPGKQVRIGRFMGKRSDAKKAIVTLRKGESIAVHKGV